MPPYRHVTLGGSQREASWEGLSVDRSKQTQPNAKVLIELQNLYSAVESARQVIDGEIPECNVADL